MIERTVSKRKKNEKKNPLLDRNSAFWNSCDPNNPVCSITTDTSDVDFFKRERSMMSMNSIFMRIKHDLVQKNLQNECCVFKVSQYILKYFMYLGKLLDYICRTQIYSRFQIYGRFLIYGKCDVINAKQLKSMANFCLLQIYGRSWGKSTV